MSFIKYEVSATCEFSAAHQVHGIDGPCARLHGHNFKLEVTASSTQLCSVGFALDFYKLDNLVKDLVLQKLDHQYINELDEFKDINPTCENIALWIYKEIKQPLKSFEAKLESVSLWENNSFKITISENDND